MLIDASNLIITFKPNTNIDTWHYYDGTDWKYVYGVNSEYVYVGNIKNPAFVSDKQPPLDNDGWYWLWDIEIEEWVHMPKLTIR